MPGEASYDHGYDTNSKRGPRERLGGLGLSAEIEGWRIPANAPDTAPAGSGEQTGSGTPEDSGDEQPDEGRGEPRKTVEYAGCEEANICETEEDGPA